MKSHPVVYKWREVDVIEADGEVRRALAMVPLPRYHNVAKRQFADGEDYTLAPVEERSQASHGQFFAAMQDAFDNIPEKLAARWPTPTHFRRWLLIETGHFDEKEFDCPDEKFAKRLGLFIRTEDEYARIGFHKNDDGKTWKVIVRRAKSQSIAAMKKVAFEQSKKDVLELAEHMTGVEPGTLMREAGRSA